jgi:hypothetical protein
MLEHIEYNCSLVWWLRGKKKEKNTRHLWASSNGKSLSSMDEASELIAGDGVAAVGGTKTTGGDVRRQQADEAEPTKQLPSASVRDWLLVEPDIGQMPVAPRFALPRVGQPPSRMASDFA